MCGESNNKDRKQTCLRRNVKKEELVPELLEHFNETLLTKLLEKQHNQISGKGNECKKFRKFLESKKRHYIITASKIYEILNAWK